jgi:MFS family permease
MASLLIYFGGLSAVWAFVERIADGNGIDAITIGQALSFGVIGGGVGAFIAAISGDRFGRVRPLFFSALIIAAALWIYNGSFSGITFAIVTFLFSGAWNYSLAYQLGIVASVDASGRYVVLMSAALASGAVLGPAVAGFLINDGGFEKVHVMAIIAVAIATTAYIYLVRVKQAAAPDGPTHSKLRG